MKRLVRIARIEILADGTDTTSFELEGEERCDCGKRDVAEVKIEILSGWHR